MTAGMVRVERRGQPPRRGVPSYYDGYTDRRQAPGIVAHYCRCTGGELVRSRVDYGHLAAILRAKRAAESAVLLDEPVAVVAPGTPARATRVYGTALLRFLTLSRRM